MQTCDLLCSWEILTPARNSSRGENSDLQRISSKEGELIQEEGRGVRTETSWATKEKCEVVAIIAPGACKMQNYIYMHIFKKKMVSFVWFIVKPLLILMSIRHPLCMCVHVLFSDCPKKQVFYSCSVGGWPYHYILFPYLVWTFIDWLFHILFQIKLVFKKL